MELPPPSAVSNIERPIGQGRVICFVSVKGGSGKTVITTSTAYVLTRSGKRVVLIDADFSTRGLSLFVLSSLIDAGDLRIPAGACLAESALEKMPVTKVTPLVVSGRSIDFNIILANRNVREGGVPDDRLL